MKSTPPSRSRMVAQVLAAFWGLSLILWPVPSNVGSSDGERDTASTGEGLYKSELTEANFGLLGVRFYESSGTRRSWNIRSEFAELHRQDKNYAFMKTVDADFFALNSGNIVHTKSDYGRSYFGKRMVELEGNVIVNSAKGYRFLMNTLDYDGATHRFKSNDEVSMTGPNPDKPDMFLTGTGLDADMADETFVVKRNTRSRRRMGKNDWIRIQSARGEFHPETQRAVFTGKVRAQLPNLTIESERLEMNVGDPANEILKADGRVRLVHKDRKGRAKKADIEIGNDKIVLSGDAEISGGDNDLKGSRITLHTDEDSIEVEQAEGSLQ